MGLHPQVVAAAFCINLRSVFRHFERGNLRTVGETLLAEKSHVMELLTAKFSSYSQGEVRKRLHVTQGTLIFWRRARVIDVYEVFSERRIARASIAAILALGTYRPEHKHKLFEKLSPDDRFALKSKLWTKTDELSKSISEQALINANRQLQIAIKKFEAEERRLRYLYLTKKSAQ